jgi:DNA polymerase
MSAELYEIIEGAINHLKFINEFRPGKLNFEIPKSKNINKNTEYLADKPKKQKNTAQETELFQEEWMFSETLSELEKQINKCSKCHLSRTRTNFVFGTGNPQSDIVVVGEAPGNDEDLQGVPFVGRAGQLLTDILKAIDLKREDIFICNILKCRPPGNRNPMPEEIIKCRPYLEKQLSIIKPKMILALGTFAAQTLLNTKETLGRLRGNIHDYVNNGRIIKVLVTYHPAALLRNPNWKRPTWEDMKLFRKIFNEMLSQ